MSQAVSQSSSETSFKVVKQVVKRLSNQLQLLDTHETEVEGETMACRKAKLTINKRKGMVRLLPIVHTYYYILLCISPFFFLLSISF